MFEGDKLNNESKSLFINLLIIKSSDFLGLSGLVGCNKMIISGCLSIFFSACFIALSVVAVSVASSGGRFIIFAPAVLEEDLDLYFSSLPNESPFMLFTAQVLKNNLPAITHVDGSARIQTVTEETGVFI